MSNFFEELKNRNVYKVATASIPTTPSDPDSCTEWPPLYTRMCKSSYVYTAKRRGHSGSEFAKVNLMTGCHVRTTEGSDFNCMLGVSHSTCLYK